jgi:hypothetical protein
MNFYFHVLIFFLKINPNEVWFIIINLLIPYIFAVAAVS